MSHRVSSVSLSPRITRVTISRFGDSGYSHPAPAKATLIGALRKAMNRLSALILNTYFPAFSHKGCGKSTFSVRRDREPVKMQVRHVHAGIHRASLRRLGRKVVDVGDFESVARGSTDHRGHICTVKSEG